MHSLLRNNAPLALMMLRAEGVYQLFTREAPVAGNTFASHALLLSSNQVFGDLHATLGTVVGDLLGPELSDELLEGTSCSNGVSLTLVFEGTIDHGDRLEPWKLTIDLEPKPSSSAGSARIEEMEGWATLVRNGSIVLDCTVEAERIERCGTTSLQVFTSLLSLTWL